MITTPDRIGDIIGRLERGQPVDLKLTATLQGLDMVAADRKFMTDAILETERADGETIGHLRGYIKSTAGRT